MIRRPPRSTLFPYTTLFRSVVRSKRSRRWILPSLPWKESTIEPNEKGGLSSVLQPQISAEWSGKAAGLYSSWQDSRWHCLSSRDVRRLCPISARCQLLPTYQRLPHWPSPTTSSVAPVCFSDKIRTFRSFERLLPLCFWANETGQPRKSVEAASFDLHLNLCSPVIKSKVPILKENRNFLIWSEIINLSNQHKCR